MDLGFAKLLVGLFAVGILSCNGKKYSEEVPQKDTVTALTGNNPVAGRYAQAGDAKIYYEVYGQGEPLVLLHSDFYGYIDDFDDYIPELEKHYRVIAIGKRGHGRSEMGSAAFSESLFADDVLTVLRQENTERAGVLGFGGGATTAYYLAAHHPGHITKVAALAGLLSSEGYRKGVKEELAKLTFKQINDDTQGFVARRRRLMPQPQRLEELLDRLKDYWASGTFVEPDKVNRIACPVLVVTGDRDYYQGLEAAIDIQKAIPGAKLKVIPGCDHAGLTFRPDMLSSVIIPFFHQQGI